MMIVFTFIVLSSLLDLVSRYASCYAYVAFHALDGYSAGAASAGFMIFGIVALHPSARTLVRRSPPPNTLILGSESGAEKLYAEMVRTEPAVNVRMVSATDIKHIAQYPSVSRIVVADSRIQQNRELAQALLDCKLRGVTIETPVESFEKLKRKIWIEALSPDWLLFGKGFKPSRFYLAAKRVFDILLAVLVLVLTGPLMILIAAAIKLESPGEAIFSQDRVGLRGRTFKVYKFRSMRQDAERNVGPTWAKENDDRITALGKCLRRSRLDEIPQAFNVLLGDMSFVGPRPERPYFVDLLKTNIPYYGVRHYVRPGITGWAQVMYPYGASVEDAYQKLQYDLYYAKNASFRLDLLVLLRTIKVVVALQGR
jgi:sugar transferase (PEP-CTERM system associated)